MNIYIYIIIVIDNIINKLTINIVRLMKESNRTDSGEIEKPDYFKGLDS